MNSFMRISDIDWWPQIIIDNPPIEKFLYYKFVKARIIKRRDYG